MSDVHNGTVRERCAPPNNRQSRDGRREQEADEGQGELLGEVAFGAAVQDREVAAHSLGDQPAGTGSMKDTGRRPAEPGGETAVGFGGEDRGRFGHQAQLSEGLGERGPGRVQATEDEAEAAADPGAAAEGEYHDRASRSPSRVVIAGAFARGTVRARPARVIFDSHTKLAANRPPTKNSTNWPRAEPYGAR